MELYETYTQLCAENLISKEANCRIHSAMLQEKEESAVESTKLFEKHWFLIHLLGNSDRVPLSWQVDNT